LRTVAFHQASHAADGIFLLLHQTQSTGSGGGLNAPNTSGNPGFLDDFEKTNVTSGGSMSAATEFHAEITKIDDPDPLPVFLAEECCGTGSNSFVGCHLPGIYRTVLADAAIDFSFDAAQLFSCDCRKMTEIEAQTIRGDQGTCLLDMITQNFD